MGVFTPLIALHHMHLAHVLRWQSFIASPPFWMRTMTFPASSLNSLPSYHSLLGPPAHSMWHSRLLCMLHLPLSPKHITASSDGCCLPHLPPHWCPLAWLMIMSRSCHTIPCWACQLPTMRPWISVHYLGSHLLYFIYVSAYSCLTDCCTWLYFGAWVNFWCLFPLDRLIYFSQLNYILAHIPTWQIAVLSYTSVLGNDFGAYSHWTDWWTCLHLAIFQGLSLLDRLSCLAIFWWLFLHLAIF